MIRNHKSTIAISLTCLAALLLYSTLAAEKRPPSKPIDLNAATLKELEELPGVGKVTAQRIIDTRQKSGRFRRVEDLMAIRGISQKKLDAMRPYIMVSAPAAAPAAPKNSPPPKKPNPN